MSPVDVVPYVQKIARKIAAKCVLPASVGIEDLVGAGLVAYVESEKRRVEQGKRYAEDQAPYDRISGAMVDVLRQATKYRSFPSVRVFNVDFGALNQDGPLSEKQFRLSCQEPGYLTIEAALTIPLLLQKLPAIHRLVIEMHHLQGMEMAAIGDLLDLTESRISQIHSQALSTLQAMANVDSAAEVAVVADQLHKKVRSPNLSTRVRMQALAGV